MLFIEAKSKNAMCGGVIELTKIVMDPERTINTKSNHPKH